MGVKASCFPTAMAKLELMTLWMFGSKLKKKRQVGNSDKVHIIVDGVKYVISISFNHVCTGMLRVQMK